MGGHGRERLDAASATRAAGCVEEAGRIPTCRAHGGGLQPVADRELLALAEAEAVAQAALQEALAALAVARRLIAVAVRLPAPRPTGVLRPGRQGREQRRQGDKRADRRRPDSAWHRSVHIHHRPCAAQPRWRTLLQSHS